MLQVIQNYRSGHLEVVEVPRPASSADRLLVRCVASAISAGTERHLVEMGGKSLLGKAIARPDLVRRVLDKVKTDGVLETVQQVRQRLDSCVPLGHSAAGIVVDVGKAVSGFRVGDRVSCAGQDVAVHAEFLSVPPTLAVHVPADLPLDQAAFANVGAIPLHAIRLSGAAPGEWVAVIGLGLLGLLAVQILRNIGCRVIALDVAPEKLPLAQALGAEVTLDAGTPATPASIEASTGGHGVDAVLITAATQSNDPLELAAKTCRTKGRIVAVGLVGLDVPRDLFFERELELVVSQASGPGLYDRAHREHAIEYPYQHVRWTHARNMAEILRLLAIGAIRLGPLISHRFPIAQATEAFEILRSERPHQTKPIGIVLEYESRTGADSTVVRANRPAVGAVNGAIGIGLIGAGLFAKTTLLPELRRMRNLRFVGVATASGTTAHYAARNFGFEYATSDVRQLFEDPEIQCVIIATRHDSHAQLVVSALGAGKNVFVEKPLAMSIAELEEVVAAWRSAPGRLMVGFNRRHSPHATEARRFLAGAGGPLIVHCRVNAGAVPQNSWVNDPLSGGDRIRGELCHFVDLAQYLIGSQARRVEATALPVRSGETAIEDVTATLHFGDGSVANIVYTALGHRSLARERIEAFRAGSAVIIDNFRLTRFYGVGVPNAKRTWRLDRGYRTELESWFRALSDGGEAPVPFDAYAGSTLTTLAITEALKSGSGIDVDRNVMDRCFAGR